MGHKRKYDVEKSIDRAELIIVHSTSSGRFYLVQTSAPRDSIANALFLKQNTRDTRIPIYLAIGHTVLHSSCIISRQTRAARPSGYATGEAYFRSPFRYSFFVSRLTNRLLAFFTEIWASTTRIERRMIIRGNPLVRRRGVWFHEAWA